MRQKGFLSFSFFFLKLSTFNFDLIFSREGIIQNKNAYKSIFLNHELWKDTDIKIQEIFFLQFSKFFSRSKQGFFNLFHALKMNIVKIVLLCLKEEIFNESFVPESLDLLEYCLTNLSKHGQNKSGNDASQTPISRLLQKTLKSITGFLVYTVSLDGFF